MWSAVFVFAGDHFPLEARHHLAPWIDQNFTADLDLGNPQHEEHARSLVMELVAQLESKAGDHGGYPGTVTTYFPLRRYFVDGKFAIDIFDDYNISWSVLDTIRIL